MAPEAVKVTVDNFVRAETDRMFKRFVDQIGLGRFLHNRQPTPVDKQDVIRMNRDTLYSAAIVDLSSPATIVKPDPGGRFQSMMVVSEDHYTLPVEHDSGLFTITEDAVGTRYAAIVIRTFADPNDPGDIAAANELQDQLQIRQADPGSFELPDWDDQSLTSVRDALNVLAVTRTDFTDAFGPRDQVDWFSHLLGTASGWGGNPQEAAMYAGGVPARNDGTTPYALTVRDVPVDGFWSVTVYNKNGFLEPNEDDAYSFNNVTAAKDRDGAVTIHFGGDPDSTNYLPITPGWGYVVRLYRPRQEVLDGSWTFPEAKAVVGGEVHAA